MVVVRTKVVHLTGEMDQISPVSPTSLNCVGQLRES